MLLPLFSYIYYSGPPTQRQRKKFLTEQIPRLGDSGFCVWRRVLLLAEHNSTNSIIQISTSINNVTEVESPQTPVSRLTRLRTAMSVPGFIISDICTLYGDNYSALPHRRWRPGSLTMWTPLFAKSDWQQFILSRKERTHFRFSFCTTEHFRK